MRRQASAHTRVRRGLCRDIDGNRGSPPYTLTGSKQGREHVKLYPCQEFSRPERMPSVFVHPQCQARPEEHLDKDYPGAQNPVHHEWHLPAVQRGSSRDPFGDTSAHGVPDRIKVAARVNHAQPVNRGPPASAEHGKHKEGRRDRGQYRQVIVREHPLREEPDHVSVGSGAVISSAADDM